MHAVTMMQYIYTCTSCIVYVYDYYGRGTYLSYCSSYIVMEYAALIVLALQSVSAANIDSRRMKKKLQKNGVQPSSISTLDLNYCGVDDTCDRYDMVMMQEMKWYIRDALILDWEYLSSCIAFYTTLPVCPSNSYFFSIIAIYMNDCLPLKKYMYIQEGMDFTIVVLPLGAQGRK